MSEEIDAGGLIGRDFRSNWVWVSSWRFYIPSNSEILWFLSLCSKNFCRRKNISSRTATLPELQPQILICLLLDILPVSINLQESRESGVRITALSFWAPDHTPAGSLTDSMSSTPMAKSSILSLLAIQSYLGMLEISTLGSRGPVRVRNSWRLPSHLNVHRVPRS